MEVRGVQIEVLHRHGVLSQGTTEEVGSLVQTTHKEGARRYLFFFLFPATMVPE